MARKTEHTFVLKGSDKTKSATDSAKSNMNSLSKTAGKTAAAVAAIAVATTGIAIAMAEAQATTTRELTNMVRMANTTTKEFERLAYATSAYGIENEKLADILKDINDRVGDFIQTGGGPMADFFENIAPRVGVTAEQFRNLSGPQSLQLYIESLQKANLAQSEMTFYMEAVASDSTLLLDLYADNSAQLKRLTGEYDDFNAELALTVEQENAMRELANTFDLVGETASNAARILTATIAPELIGFLKDTLELLPKVTGALVDFMNQFRSAENINSIAQVETQIARVEEELAKVLEDIDGFTGRPAPLRHLKADARELEEELLLLNAQLETLQQNQEQTQQGGNDEPGLQIGITRGTEEPDQTVDIYENDFMTWEEIQAKKEARHLRSLQFQLMAEAKHAKEVKAMREETAKQNISAAYEVFQASVGFAAQESQLKYQALLSELQDSRNMTKAQFDEKKKAAEAAFEDQQNYQVNQTRMNTAAAVIMELATNPNPISKWVSAGAIYLEGEKRVKEIEAQKFNGGAAISYSPQQPATSSASSGSSASAGSIDQYQDPIAGTGGGPTFIFQGDVTGLDERTLAESITKQIYDDVNYGDLILVESFSRNAQDIRGDNPDEY